MPGRYWVPLSPFPDFIGTYLWISDAQMHPFADLGPLFAIFPGPETVDSCVELVHVKPSNIGI